ncbi:hypothetical protein EDB85DRAFT_1891820 [Lactarius pseudohatsudake]|nr:hypothetical protein EDB85DRAFT_1891820 [Lactarius pseudohatsudake]
MNDFLHRSGTCGPTLLQCGIADPDGAHGRASPQRYTALSLTVKYARLFARVQGRRLLSIATTSLHPILSDFGLTSFDAESRVALITDLTVFDRVLEAVELFHTRYRRHAVSMPRQASIGTEDRYNTEVYPGVRAGSGNTVRYLTTGEKVEDVRLSR